MSEAARRFNTQYLESLRHAPANSALGRLRVLWWPSFLHACEAGPLGEVLDGLDLFMNVGRAELHRLAEDYAEQQAPEGQISKKVQLRNQFLKSNTGKMFERFVGLALAQSLLTSDSRFCVLPFNDRSIRCCRGLTRESFRVAIQMGATTLRTIIDSDLFIFDPDSETSDFFLVSIKSTLKDRFHNVPFWNLLRRAAVSEESFPEITVESPGILSRAKYIAICSDLAQEQPDFGTSGGARMLLQVDAALLDGAYVTASRAQGVAHTGRHLGHDRDAAFFRLSNFFDYLVTGNN